MLDAVCAGILCWTRLRRASNVLGWPAPFGRPLPIPKLPSARSCHPTTSRPLSTYNPLPSNTKNKPQLLSILSGLPPRRQLAPHYFLHHLAGLTPVDLTPLTPLPFPDTPTPSTIAQLSPPPHSHLYANRQTKGEPITDFRTTHTFC